MNGGSPLQQRARARVGSLLKDKWRLESLLGVGGTAAVYAAAHRNGKRAAIKILHPELSTNTELVGRFLREGYVANKLEHPGAVSVLDDDRADDGSVFLVMELLDGYSLERHTRHNAERLSLDQVLRIGDEMLDVLAAAHTKGVIHRDIKPANLFLSRDGKLKVLDFGIARLTEGSGDVSATQTGAAIGTPAFMPPEQARGRWNIVDARTDLWAVGATMFALLTGRRPRRADTVNEELLLAMTEAVPKLSNVAPDVPRPIADVVDRALEFDMAARWPTARDMQFALRRARDQVQQACEPISVPSAQPDTAPVVHGFGLPPAPPPIANVPNPPPPPVHDVMDARLTTSRPMVTGGLTASPDGRGKKLGALFAVAAVLAIACGVGAAFLVRQSHAAAGPAAAVAAHVDPDPKPTTVVAPPPPSTPAAVPPPTTLAVTDLPTSPAASAPVAAPATLKPAPGAAVVHVAAPKPTPSAKPSAAATVNPWDSRF